MSSGLLLKKCRGSLHGLCALALLLVVHGAPALALTRFESPARWQVYQDLVGFRKQLGVAPECVLLSPRHSYTAGAWGFTLLNGPDKACRLYGAPGKPFGTAAVDRRSFAVSFDGFFARLKPSEVVSPDVVRLPAAWSHPTLNTWAGLGARVLAVELTENQLKKVFHVALPPGVTLMSAERMVQVAATVCRSNAGWNYDVVDTATGDMATVRCHASGALYVSTLHNLVYAPAPGTVEGVQDWDGRTEY